MKYNNSFARSTRRTKTKFIDFIANKGKQNLIVIAALVVLVLVFALLNPNFINFFKLRKGSSKIRLEAENEIKSGKLTIYMQYKAV